MKFRNLTEALIFAVENDFEFLVKKRVGQEKGDIKESSAIIDVLNNEYFFFKTELEANAFIKDYNQKQINDSISVPVISVKKCLEFHKKQKNTSPEIRSLIEWKEAKDRAKRNHSDADPYAELGVSSKKEGVHEATKNLSKGLFPGAFCKVVPLVGNLPQDIKDNYVQVIHSDGVGTKSNVAYIARKEGYSTDIYRTLPQDALVMNTDDMACVGVINDIYISNHIARNANRVSDEDIATIIGGYQDFFQLASSFGVNIYDAGGETADVGSYTTTLGIDVTASAIIEKDKVIDCNNIKPGGYIVALASNGQSSYEKQPNSGIRSNGLTLAINSLLSPYYRKYTEAMDQTISQDKLFTGHYMLDDVIRNKNTGEEFTIAQAILSPTRTYLPILKMCQEFGLDILGIIHCSGGGMTKSANFGNNIRYVKSNLLPTPVIFSEIQAARNIDDKYMYQTFNMGTGMEIIVPDEDTAQALIQIAQKFNVDARIIGYTEMSKSHTNEVIIQDKGKTLEYKK